MTANNGAGTKTAAIVIGSVSTATERVIGTGTGSTGIGNESRMGTGIERGSGTAIEIESGTRRDEMIGTVAVAVEVEMAHVLRGSTRNPDGRTIDAVSSGAMMIIVVIGEGAKRARLLAGAAVAVEHGKMLAALRQRGGRRLPQTQGLWMGRPCTGV